MRRGYKDFEPVANGNEFVPRNAEQKIPAYLNAQQKQRLIDNGTYNPDGSVNLRTAEKLGWTKMWAATATQQPHAVATDK